MSGTVVVARGAMAWHVESRARPTQPNTQFALRVIVPLAGPLAFCDARGREHETTAPIVVPVGVPYATLRGGSRLGLTLHPLLDGRAITWRATSPTVLAASVAERVRAIADTVIAGTADPLALHRELLIALDIPLGPLVDRRVRAVLDSLATDDASIASLAPHHGLSADHLRHVISDELGDTARHIARWLRFVRAVETMWAPDSLARVAAHAGFADQAHLTRTFRGVVGHPPSLRSEVQARHLAAFYPA